jgi:HTH-type transcriptional regulator / antitoxin HipB
VSKIFRPLHIERYIAERKQRDAEFAVGFEEGYEQCKIGATLRQAREAAGLTQERIAQELKTTKSAISRLENHAEDVRLSTLRKYAHAVGKNIDIQLS